MFLIAFFTVAARPRRPKTWIFDPAKNWIRDFFDERPDLVEEEAALMLLAWPESVGQQVDLIKLPVCIRMQRLRARGYVVWSRGDIRGLERNWSNGRIREARGERIVAGRWVAHGLAVEFGPQGEVLHRRWYVEGRLVRDVGPDGREWVVDGDTNDSFPQEAFQ